jgi:hypothetical protein
MKHLRQILRLQIPVNAQESIGRAQEKEVELCQDSQEGS